MPPSAYKYSVGFAIEPVLMAIAIPIVIVALAQWSGWVASLINTPVLVLMGEASYGMYLFHPMLMLQVAHGVEGPSAFANRRDGGVDRRRDAGRRWCR